MSISGASGRWGVTKATLAGLATLGLLAAACNGATPEEAPETAVDEVADDDPDEDEPATDASDEGDSDELLEVTTVVGGAAGLPIFCYMTVGQDEALGLFQEEGLAVEQLGLAGTGPTLTALAAGQADIASGTPDPLANLIADGVEPGIKTTYVVGGTIHWEVVALPDSEYDTIEDLAGAKIGVPHFGISTYPGMQRMLTEVGIDPENDVEFVAVGSGADMIRALQTGDADVFAGTTFQTASAEVLDIEFKQIPLSPQGQDMFGTTIVMRDGLVEDHPDAVEGYLRAVTRGIIFMEENPEACAQIHWEIFPDSKPAGVSDEEALAQSVHLIERNSAGYGPSPLDQDGLYGFVADSRWESTLEVYEIEDIPLDRIRDFSLVEAANDFDVEAWREFARSYEYSAG